MRFSRKSVIAHLLVTTVVTFVLKPVTGNEEMHKHNLELEKSATGGSNPPLSRSVNDEFRWDIQIQNRMLHFWE